jgi:hypothetical protein
MIRERNARCYVTSTVLVLALNVACHQMHAVPAAHVNSADLPPRIWVTSVDRSTVILDAPRVSGDTLAGWVSGQYHEMLLSQTKTIETREPAPTRTALLVTATSLVALGGLFYLESRQDVGNAQVCLNASDHIPDHFTPCCVAQDSVPC